MITMGYIGRPEKEKVIILEPLGRPEEAPVTEPVLVPEREPVPA